MSTRREFIRLAGLSGLAGVPLWAGCASGSPSRPWTPSSIERMSRLAASRDARAYGIWNGGHPVASYNTDARSPSLSITKSIAALAAARARTQGWLFAEEKVSNTIPEWRGDPVKSRITLSMLLQQVSGLEGGSAQLYRADPADKGRAAVALKVIDEPGTTFRYGPASWELLAEVMRRKLAVRKDTLEGFLIRSVLTPLGISSPKWRMDRVHVPYLSTGAEFNIRDMGQLGKMLGLLLKGMDVAGFKAMHFKEMVKPSSVNPMFGGGIWRNTGRAGGSAIEIEAHLNDPESSFFWRRACLSRFQPSDLVALVGSGGKRLYIWPTENRVVARIGASMAWRDGDFLAIR